MRTIVETISATVIAKSLHVQRHQNLKVILRDNILTAQWCDLTLFAYCSLE
jgi:hypothetical protein